jgi:DNA excision repair protein ERCC-2
MANDHPEQQEVPPDFAGSAVEPDVIETESSGESDSRDHDSDGLRLIDLDDIDEYWTPYFRYDTVYGDQVDAIDSFLDLLADNGYYLLEGACGTGKTLAAVSAGITAIRHQSELGEERIDEDNVNSSFPDYSRILVTTPLKQQLKQFVDEMKGINQSISSDTAPVATTVLRGRRDMMPYADVDLQPFDENPFNQQMDDLREMTAELIRFGSDIPLDWPDGVTPAPWSRYDYDWSEASETAEQHRDKYRFDPARAEVVRDLVMDMDSRDGNELDSLVVDGVETPYPEYIPATPDVADQSKTQGGQLRVDLTGKFDPFYAGFFAFPNLPFGFKDGNNYVFDQESMVREAASRGICPHEAMADFASRSEVVLGNYTHLFDPETRYLTDGKLGLLDGQTISVVDEAHQIEGRVRDMLSESVDLYTLDRAQNDIDIAYNYAIGNFEKTPTPGLNKTDKDTAQNVLSRAVQSVQGVSSFDDLEEIGNFLNEMQHRLGALGGVSLNEEFGDSKWKDAIKYNWDVGDTEYALSDPESDDIDDLVEVIELETEFTRDTFIKAHAVMKLLDYVYDELEDEGIHTRSPQGAAVGEFFKRWFDEDNVEYHRQVVLEHSEKESFPSQFPEYVEYWTPKLELYNCIPRDKLRQVFSQLGGGVLMSATIKPEEVFQEAVGVGDIPYEWGKDELDALDIGSDDEQDDSELHEVSEAEDDVPDRRPSVFEQFPLRFPVENRLSLTLDLPRFTNRKRGDRTVHEPQMTDARKQYAEVLKQIAYSQGNALVVMPNYGEARWARNYLAEQGVNKQLHLDESTSSQETDRILDSFFSDDEAILFTSALGTVTEGVDYDGDKLHCCAVIGIPLLPTHQPHIQAIKAAYDQRMSFDSGFETALTAPAVRKARQAIGRVIRGTTDVGVRLLVDERYQSNDFYGVKSYLSDQEQDEFTDTSVEFLGKILSSFWDDINERSDELRNDESRSETTQSQQESDDGQDSQPQSDGSNTESSDNSEISENPDPASETYSKIYFGDGSSLSGWTEIRTDIAENEIIPLVKSNTVDDADETDVDTVNMTFASELSIGGWTEVKADVVQSEIEPIAKSDAARPSTAGTSSDTDSESESYSKLYFGEGANLSGWTPVRTDIAENEIVPLVKANTIENPDNTDVDTIKMTFASELSVNGWTDIKADTVLDDIEPIAEKFIEI